MRQFAAVVNHEILAIGLRNRVELTKLQESFTSLLKDKHVDVLHKLLLRIEDSVSVVDSEETKEADELLQLVVSKWPKLYALAAKKWRCQLAYLEKTEILLDLFDSSIVSSKLLPIF